MTIGELTERPTISKSVSGYLIARVLGKDHLVACPRCNDPLNEWGMVTGGKQNIPKRFYCCTCHKGGSSSSLLLIAQEHAECFPEDSVPGPFDRDRFLQLVRNVSEALADIDSVKKHETIFRAVGRAMERGSSALLYARRIAEPDHQAAIVAAHKSCLDALRKFRQILEWRGMEP